MEANAQCLLFTNREGYTMEKEVDVRTFIPDSRAKIAHVP